MQADIDAVANTIKDNLQNETVDELPSLVRFANNYAVTAKLRHQALLLKLNYGKTDDRSQRERLKREMIDLVDEIVADHSTLAHSEDVLRRQQAIELVRFRYRDVQPPRDVVFACEDLGRTYAKSRFTLSGVNLALRLGTITGVVGENANGKTTLFRLVVGELRHTAGTLSYPSLNPKHEDDINWPQVKSQIAYVPQELPRWYGSLKDNLQYEAAVHGVRGEDNLREVDYVIERLDLRDHLGKSWPELSGGFKLRFSLAKALVWKPKLLALDKPLGNLDFKAQQTVLRDVQDLTRALREPMAVLISSQHLHEIEAVSDTIVFLKKGRVAYNGPIEGIGETRTCNTYELGTDCDLDTLRQLLGEANYADIHFTGINYIITTPVEVTAHELLLRLLDSGVEVEYFRNISRSVKQLFD